MSSEETPEEAPDTPRISKREAVARLFLLGSAGPHARNLEPSPAKSQFDSPLTAEFRDCKEALTTNDRVSVVKTVQIQENSNRSESPPLYEPAFVNRQPTPFAYQASGLAHSSVISSNAQSLSYPPYSTLMLHNDSLRQARNRTETFSYTGSDYFRISNPLVAQNHTVAQAKNFNLTENATDYSGPFQNQGNEVIAAGNEQRASLVSADSNIGSDTDSDNGKTRRRRPASSMKILIGLLCLSLLVSLYFALFGSPVAFRNFYNSLPEQQKQEIVQELKFEHMALPELTTSSNTANRRKARPFLGVTYTPAGTEAPICNYALEDAVRDMTLVSGITLKVRTYGTQCHQMSYILYALDIIGLDLKVAMGIWIGNERPRNENQIAEAKQLLLTSNIAPIEAIYVGNEALSHGDISETELIGHIRDMKAFLKEHQIDIPVGTAEIADFVTTNLTKECDVIGLNIQPFLSGISPTYAADWSLHQYKTVKENFKNSTTKFTITEIGWPYYGGQFKLAEADPIDYNIFMHSWTKDTSRELTLSWYFHEAFNEPWKMRFNDDPDTWETEWGIFGNDLRLRVGVLFEGNIRDYMSYTIAKDKTS